MTYKDTLFFIGKALTINHIGTNKIIVENRLKKGQVDWNEVVKVSTAHYVFPALYCNLKRARFLNYVPLDLVDYMKRITQINRERNELIIKQAKEINNILLANNITPIFLKGTGNLLEGIYDDIGERMVGDIDFIVSKEKYLESVNLLKNLQYKCDDKLIREYHWHYPTMVHPDKIAAVEIHNKLLRKPYHNFFNYNTIKKSITTKSNLNFLSDHDKILNTVLPKIYNDNLYYEYKISLRLIYDVFQLSNRLNRPIEIDNKKIAFKFNNVVKCIYLVLNKPMSSLFCMDHNTSNYQKKYLRKLKTPNKNDFKNLIIKHLKRVKAKLTILRYSFTDREYRTFTIKRILQLKF